MWQATPSSALPPASPGVGAPTLPLISARFEDQRSSTTLGERIEDLGRDGCRQTPGSDVVERPYVGQWLVDIQQRYRGPDSSEPTGPDPTGTNDVADPLVFAWYGRRVLGTPDGPPTASMSIPPERCQVSDAGQADEIRTALKRTGALPPTENRLAGATPCLVTLPTTSSSSSPPCRPGELSLPRSTPKAPEAAERPGPVTPPTPETPRTDLTLVCSWLDLTWPRPVSPRTIWHDACRR